MASRAFRAALALALATPLLALPHVGDVPRALGLRGAAALLGALLVWRLPRGAGRLIAAGAGLWVASHALSAIAAIDTTAAIWGSPEGRLGLATAIAAALLIPAVAALPGRALRWCASACVATAFASLAVDILPSEAALGWVALCGAGLGGWIAARERRASWALVAAACALIALFRGGASGIAGFWFGGIVALAVFRDEGGLGVHARRLVTLAFVLSIVVPTTVLIVQHFEFLRLVFSGPSFVDALATKPRVFELGARWSAALEAGRSRPLLGAGAGSFPYAWDYFFPAGVFDVAPAARDARDAGSTFLNAFAERGALGPISELLLLVAGFATVSVRRQRGELGAAAATALAALLVARGAHGLFAGPDVAGLAMLSVILGLCVGNGRATGRVDGRGSPGAPTDRLTHAPVQTPVRVTPARLAVGLILAAFAVIPPATTAAFAARGAATLPALPPVTLDPLASHVRANLAAQVPDVLDAASADRLIDAASDALIDRLDASERDVRAARALARLAVAAHERCGRDDLLAPARERLEDVIGWAPTRADLSIALHDLYRAEGRPDEALEWAEDAWTLAQTWPEAVWRYAEALAATGTPGEARDLLDQAEADGITFTGRGLDVVRTLRE